MDWHWLKDFLSREHKAELKKWEKLKGEPLKSLIAEGYVVSGELSGTLFEANDPDATVHFREDDRPQIIPFTEDGSLGQALIRYKEQRSQIEILETLEDNCFRIKSNGQTSEGSNVLICPSPPLEDEYVALGYVIDQCIDGAVPKWEALLELEPQEEDVPIDNVSLFEKLKVLRDEFSLPLTLVQGPPGTGKTYLIGQLVNEWSHQGLSILLTASTNRAVDEMLRKTVSVGGENVAPLFRAGRDQICREFKEVSSSKKVLPYPSGALGTTLYKCATTAAQNSSAQFDVAVIDEASQVKLPSLFAVALLAKKIVVVGDHKQLPPVIVQEEAERVEINAYRCSAFEYLVKRRPHFMMRETYRLNKVVCAFIGNRYYEGKLQSRPEVADVIWPDIPEVNWLCPRPGVTHLVVPHLGGDTQSSALEASTVAQLIVRLEKNIGAWFQEKDKLNSNTATVGEGPLDKRYMISCLFRRQASLVRSEIRRAGIPNHLWHVDTVERNQGQTASVAILCVGAKTPDVARGAGWVLDPRRWNVALSRGRYKAYVVSSDSFISYIENENVNCVSRNDET